MEVSSMDRQDSSPQPLPACVTDYINRVIRRMRYSRAARREVRQELLDHFTDALADCPDPQQRQKLAETLITEFGDTKMLAALLRRAKKRNRPAWIKALIRTAQAFILLLVLFGLYTAWFMTGRPTVTTNYLAVLSDKMHPKAPESENAWPFYREAMLRFVPMVPLPVLDPYGPPWTYTWPETDMDPAGMPDAVRKTLDKWINQNEAAWESFVAASRKPYNWYARDSMEDFQYEWAKVDAARKGETIQPRTPSSQPDELLWKDSVISSLLPHLSSMRALAKIGIFKAHLAAARGNMPEAMEEVLTAARVARHWQNPNGYVIEQLVGVAISSLACQEICRLAASKGLTSTDLRHAQEQLERLYPGGYPAFGMEPERLSLIDTVQRVFTDGGPGGGHIIPRQWRHVAFQTGGTTSNLGEEGLLAAASLVHAGRDDTLAMGNAYYDCVAAWSKLTPYQQKGEQDPNQMVIKMVEQEGWRYRFLSMLLPSLSKASELVYRSRCEYEAALSVLALQRYRLDKGQYPPSLEALVQTGYLRQAPADPYSAGPLVYRRTDDGFTLYSVSGDFADDGGVENPDDPWSGSARPSRLGQLSGATQPAPTSQPAGSDRVFWPVPALKPYPMEAEPPAGLLGR
jgi:hypothetical protein